VTLVFKESMQVESYDLDILKQFLKRKIVPKLGGKVERLIANTMVAFI